MNRLAELTASDVSRFLAHVDRSGGPEACWLWTLGCDRKGYGTMKVRKHNLYAHRIAVTVASDLAPEPDVLVCHRCDNPRCCNPGHLFLGSQADNMADMRSKGRAVSAGGEQNGRAKLRESDIQEIRRMRADGAVMRVIGARFSIDSGHVCRILQGKYWPAVDTQKAMTV